MTDRDLLLSENTLTNTSKIPMLMQHISLVSAHFNILFLFHFRSFPNTYIYHICRLFRLFNPCKVQ